MVKRYLYRYIVTGIIIGSSMNAKGVDLPTEHELRKLLNDTHHERLCLIKQADTNGHLDRIMSCHRQIQDLEARSGITDHHNKQALLMNSMCVGENQPKWCNLFEQYDQKRFERCSTIKCQIMRLYLQLNTYTTKLSEILEPKKQKLRELNEHIYALKEQLKSLYGYSQDFTMYPNMLFL